MVDVFVACLRFLHSLLTMERFPSTQDSERAAANLVNETVDTAEGQSNADLARSIETAAKEQGLEKQTAEYVNVLREQSHAFVVDALPPGVGGQFDGSRIDVAPTVLTVDKSISQTVDQIQEVTAHEAYHAMHNHTDAMMSYAGGPRVVIAGQEFTETEIIEGLTVADTGNQFVSDGYRQHEEKLRSAAASAGIGMDAVRVAVNEKKDLTEIDDRRTAPSLALAA